MSALAQLNDPARNSVACFPFDPQVPFTCFHRSILHEFIDLRDDPMQSMSFDILELLLCLLRYLSLQTESIDVMTTQGSSSSSSDYQDSLGY